MGLIYKFTTLSTACIALLFSFVSTLTFNSYAQVKATTGEERLNGLKQRKVLEDNSLLGKVKFRNIGPSVMGGRVVDVEVNPKDPTEFYIAYATGGLWHTTNNGQSLIPIFDNEDVIVIGDIAVNWTTREIWVGTGESNSSRSSYAGVGVYKSPDNGKSWKYLGLPESHHIGKVQLHPTDPNVAWVAALGHLWSPNRDRGVYKTTDGGATWKKTLYVDETTSAVDMDIDPVNPDKLYAVMWHRERTGWNFVEGGQTSGIYRSEDGGNTWKLITKEGSGFPTGTIGRIGVAVFPGDPSIIYAAVDNQGIRPDTAKVRIDSTRYRLLDIKDLDMQGFMELDDKKLDTFLMANNVDTKYNVEWLKEKVGKGSLKPNALYNYLNSDKVKLSGNNVIGCEIFRSSDGGDTWTKMNEKGINIYSTFGYYFGKITVSATNPDKIIVCGITLLLSDDGGKTFTAADKRNTHGDWHPVWMNPANDKHWLAGDDGGATITYDDGRHWFKINSPAVGQFYDIEVDNARPYNVYGGLQDNGTWFSSNVIDSANDETQNDPPPTWKRLGGGDGMQVQVDKRDNRTVYSGSQWGEYNRKTPDVRRGVRIQPILDILEPQIRFNWQTPILLSPHNQDILYHGSSRLNRSMNKGDALRPISPDLTKGRREGDVMFGTLTTISESPLKFGLIYCGTDDGNIHVTKDGGTTWLLIIKNLPKNLYVSRVAASAFKEGRVYATLNGYRNDNFAPSLYISEDYGANWTKLGNDLPAEPLNVIVEDPKYEDIIYVGSDNGVYASFDRGQKFMGMNKTLPRVPVHDIAIQKTANDIIIGTHGRSVYIANLKEVHAAYNNKEKAQ